MMGNAPNNEYIDVTGLDEIPEANGDQLPIMNKAVTIDRIRDERVNDNGEQEFLIKWKPIKESWEKVEDIKKFPELIYAYKKNKQKQSKYIDYEEEEEDDNVSHDNDGSFTNESDKRNSGRKRIPTKRYAQEDSATSGSGRQSHRLSKRRVVASKNMAGMDAEEFDEDEEYKVEKILEMKVSKNGQEKFLVKWEGFDESYNTWEPKNGISHLEVFKNYADDIKKAQKVESEDDNKEYTVETVLDKKATKYGKIKYYVKWEGFGEEWNSWEPSESLAHLEVVKKYEAENDNNQSPTTSKTPPRRGSSRKRAATPTPSSECAPSEKLKRTRSSAGSSTPAAGGKKKKKRGQAGR